MRLLVYNVYVTTSDEEEIIIPICLEKNTIKNYWDMLQDEYIWNDLPFSIFTQNIANMISTTLTDDYNVNPKNCKITKLVRDINKEMN